MTLTPHDLWPAVAAALGAALFYVVRSQAGAAATSRVAQLAEAESLLAQHAGALQQFLDDRDAPADLKRLLLSLSDAMADRPTVERLAQWAVSRPIETPPVSAEAEALTASLSALQARRPDLVEDFVAGIWTAVAGAALRWPSTAALSRAMFRSVSTPKRDVTVAVAAIEFRAGAPFSLKPMPAATLA